MDTPQDTTREHAERLTEFIAGEKLAMLVSHSTTNGLAGRPMMLVNDDPDETASLSEALPLRVTFITNGRNMVSEQVTRHPDVAVSLQNSSTQCFLRGTARISSDKARLRRLWSKGHDIWFEQGVDDPDAVMLDVDVTHASYWDNTGTAGLRFMLEAGRAMLTGDTMKEKNAGRHADLSRSELTSAARRASGN
jgi:general stress protein 26